MTDIETDTILTDTGTSTISSNDYAKLNSRNKQLEAQNKQLQSEIDRLTVECKEWKETCESMSTQVEKLESMLQRSKKSESYPDLIKLVSELKLNAETTQQKKKQDRRNPSGLVSQASVDSCNSSSFHPDTLSSPSPSRNPNQPRWMDPEPVGPNEVSMKWSPEYHHPESTPSEMPSPDAAPIHPNPTRQSEPPVNRQAVAYEARGEMVLAGDNFEKPGVLRAPSDQVSSSQGTSALTSAASNSQVSSKEEDQSVSKVKLVDDQMSSFIKKKVVKERRNLGRALGLVEVDMDEIEEIVGKDVKEVMYQMMRKWIQKEGINATPDNLIKALEEIERKDIIIEFCEKFNIQRKQSSVFDTPQDLGTGKDQTKQYNNQQSAKGNQHQQHPIHMANPPAQHPNTHGGQFQPRPGAKVNQAFQQHPNQQGGPLHAPVQQQPSLPGGMAYPPTQQHAWNATNNPHTQQHHNIQHPVTNPPEVTVDAFHRPTQAETPHDIKQLIQVPNTSRLFGSNKPAETHFGNFFPDFLKNSTSRSLKEFKKGLDKVKNLKREETKRIATEMDWTDELKDKFDSEIKSNLKVSNVLEKWAGIVYLENDGHLSTEEKKDKLQEFVRSLRSTKDKWEGREDVVKEICRHVKTGTVGTQAPPTTNYTDLPYGVRFNVAKELNMLNDNTGNGCSRIAELLGIENNLIRYLATRTEPGHQILRSWETQADATVEKLYDVLLECKISQAAEALE